MPALQEGLSLLAAPVLAGFVVLLSHARLGEAVLGRGIVFIDLAVAQLAALGGLLATVLIHDHGAGDAWARPMAGALLALAGALLIAGMCRRFAAWREALIGLVYVGAASLGVLAATAIPEGHHALAHLAAGDVLWVGWRDLLPISVATALLLPLTRLRVGSIAGEPGRHHDALLRDAVFYPAFAVLVSLSVPLLGVYLVFTSLIVPAIIRAALPGLTRLHAGLLCWLAWAAGLAVSLLADLPSGPCVVMAMLLLAAFCLFRSRRTSPR